MRRSSFTRYKLHGYVTWCLNLTPGWFRVGNWMLRWEHMKGNRSAT